MAAAGDDPVRRIALCAGRIAARVAAAGRLLAAEMLVFGRAARGERWTGGALAERWRIERARRLAWFDAMRARRRHDRPIPPASLARRRSPRALYVGADAERHLTLAREATDGCRAAPGRRW